MHKYLICIHSHTHTHTCHTHTQAHTHPSTHARTLARTHTYARTYTNTSGHKQSGLIQSSCLDVVRLHSVVKRQMTSWCVQSYSKLRHQSSNPCSTTLTQQPIGCHERTPGRNAVPQNELKVGLNDWVFCFLLQPSFDAIVGNSCVRFNTQGECISFYWWGWPRNPPDGRRLLLLQLTINRLIIPNWFCSQRDWLV